MQLKSVLLLRLPLENLEQDSNVRGCQHCRSDCHSDCHSGPRLWTSWAGSNVREDATRSADRTRGDKKRRERILTRSRLIAMDGPDCYGLTLSYRRIATGLMPVALSP